MAGLQRAMVRKLYKGTKGKRSDFGVVSAAIARLSPAEKEKLQEDGGRATIAGRAGADHPFGVTPWHAEREERQRVLM